MYGVEGDNDGKGLREFYPPCASGRSALRFEWEQPLGAAECCRIAAVPRAEHLRDDTTLCGERIPERTLLPLRR